MLWKKEHTRGDYIFIFIPLHVAHTLTHSLPGIFLKSTILVIVGGHGGLSGEVANEALQASVYTYFLHSNFTTYHMIHHVHTNNIVYNTRVY